MSIYGISTEFTESIRSVTTIHSVDLFSDRNGSKWAQTNTKRVFWNSSAYSVNQADSRNWPRSSE